MRKPREIGITDPRRSLIAPSSSPNAPDTARGFEGLCGIPLVPREAKLFFGQGARLSKSDPKKLLQGSGKTVRHVVLHSVGDFERREIEALMAGALALAKLRLDASAKGAVIIKAGEQKKRAGRARG